LGKIRYDTCCGRSRFTNSSKGRAPPAAGGCEAQQLTPLSAMKTNKKALLDTAVDASDG
jgi:hypothetical protein